MSTTDLVTTSQPGDLIDRMVAGELTTAERVALQRVVKVRKGQELPSREEFVLMLREAAHLDLDVFAGQCYFVDFGDGWACYPHWSGLVKIAEATGEYEGMDAPLYSGDGKEWTDAWPDGKHPEFARVTVYRVGHRPTTAIVKWSRVARPSTGGSRPSQWDKDPEGMLGKAAFRLALRRAFPREADKPITPDQLRALHTVASHQGLGGDERRPARLAAASEVVGRDVSSFKDLSVAEAAEVIDAWAEDEDVADAGAQLGEVVAGPAATVGSGKGVPEPTGEPWGPEPPHSTAPDGSAGEAATDPSPAPPPNPYEGMSDHELRQTVAQVWTSAIRAQPKKWRPWWRMAIEALRPGTFDSFPSGWAAPDLAEILARFEREEELSGAQQPLT